ncbi:hypothetical protein [Blastopirellula retiformator]|uniref:Uncharacterized protein n=1 Tax=Blastopirellula retiformator TaxID=2527970 RepID=A0A5C5VM67_9BACT|nr:hypothetical protein [Blastopirellula retiformator]TWT39598.1 hypothetical protein Enr8_12980 [Blastopirellula retiformator]
MSDPEPSSELEQEIRRHRRAQILSVAIGNGATLLMLIGLMVQSSLLAVGGAATTAICFISILWRGWKSAAAAKKLDESHQEKTPA